MASGRKLFLSREIWGFNCLLFIKAFFVIVVVVATVVYLGTVRDFFRMEQYTAVTPKEDMQIQGKSDKEDEKEHWRNAHEFKPLYEAFPRSKVLLG